MRMNFIKGAACLLFLALGAGLSGPAVADEIAEAISEALEAYQADDLTRANQSLQYASQLIAQKNSEALGAVLPQPLSGWTRSEGESGAAGLAMLGGGIHASATYEKGDSRIEVTIAGDSPLLAQMAPLFANPALAGAMGKIARIGGRMALETRDGQIMLVIANRFLVSVDGEGEMKDKRAYAGAVDAARLESF